MITEPGEPGDICETCNGKGYIITTEKGPKFNSPMVQFLIASVLALLVFYLAFLIYDSEHRLNLFVSIVVLFIAHIAVGSGLILYLLFSSLKAEG